MKSIKKTNWRLKGRRRIGSRQTRRNRRIGSMKTRSRRRR